MNEIRYGRSYGTGTFLGDNNNLFFDQPIMDQAKQIGYSHACPVIDKVIAEYGPIWTRNRYAECNFVYGLIVEASERNNPYLHHQLITPVQRILPDEPAGVFDLRFTPESHKYQMAPLATLSGYALPRVLIEEMGRGEDNLERTNERVVHALDILDMAIAKSNNPIELVVNISEMVCQSKADPKQVLSHLLPSGVLNEENCKTMLKETVQTMKRLSPKLYKIYNNLSDNEKSNLGIITI